MIETQAFGRTGHQSTRVIFGAAALGAMSQDRADRTLDVVRRFGVNHLDTAASYGDSELRLAPFLADHRNEVFLATKTGERQGDGARRELERSLERLGVDQVDLIQLHNLVEPQDWDVAFGPGGVVEAMADARAEGLVRFIGVTGHGLRIAARHRASLDRFDFDSVLLPYNHLVRQDPTYRAEADALIAACEARDVAVQTIKSVARRRWPETSDEPHFSWYQPLRDADAIGRAVAYVLGRPNLFLNTSSDATLLPATLEAASNPPLAVPSDDAMEQDVLDHAMAPIFDGAELERI